MFRFRHGKRAGEAEALSRKPNVRAAIAEKRINCTFAKSMFTVRVYTYFMGLYPSYLV